jgi:hypothetical protein
MKLVKVMNKLDIVYIMAKTSHTPTFGSINYLPSLLHFVIIKILPFVDSIYDIPFSSNNFLLLLEEEFESSLDKP